MPWGWTVNFTTIWIVTPVHVALSHAIFDMSKLSNNDFPDRYILRRSLYNRSRSKAPIALRNVQYSVLVYSCNVRRVYTFISCAER